MRSEPPLPPTDAQLCEALGAGGTAALATLYDRYAGLVFGLARTILASAEEAEDLTQEIFIGLQRRCAYDPARGTMSAFLAVLTRSRALDRLRTRRSRLKLHEKLGTEEHQPAAPVAPLEHAALEQSAERVREGLAALPEPQRKVIELAYFGGLSQADIAERLQTPLGTVKSWTRKGLLALRESLRDLEG